MTNAAFPGPEEMRDMMRDHHEMTMSLLVPIKNAQKLLAMLAPISALECPIPYWECETCNEFNKMWWDLCDALPQRARVELQAAMHEAGVDLPRGPWEEIPF